MSTRDIVARAETFDLRQHGLVSLTDEQVESRGAFIRQGAKGRVELLLTDRQRRAVFPDWRALMKDADFGSHVTHDKEHVTTHRRIRSNVKRERVTCIVLPD